jgi:hypothetical protein
MVVDAHTGVVGHCRSVRFLVPYSGRKTRKLDESGEVE